MIALAWLLSPAGRAAAFFKPLTNAARQCGEKGTAMELSTAARILAAETNQSEGRVKMIARRLQEIDAIDKGPGGRAAPVVSYDDIALILLALLVDEASHVAARVAVTLAGYKCDGQTIQAYLTHLLRAADFNEGDLSKHAFSANVTVHGGSEQAVVVRHACTDEPLELAFTRGGEPYEPQQSLEIIRGYTLPGLLLHRVGRGLKGVSS